MPTDSELDGLGPEVGAIEPVKGAWLIEGGDMLKGMLNARFGCCDVKVLWSVFWTGGARME